MAPGYALHQLPAPTASLLTLLPCQLAPARGDMASAPKPLVQHSHACGCHCRSTCTPSRPAGHRASRKRSVDFDMAEQRQRQSQVMGRQGQPPSHPRPLDAGHSTSTFPVIPDSPAGELRASESLSQSPLDQAAATQHWGQQTLGQAALGRFRSVGDSSDGGLSQALRGLQSPPGQTTRAGRETSDPVASPRSGGLQPQLLGAPRSARATFDASEQPLRSSQRGQSGRSNRSSGSQAGTPLAAGRPGLTRRSLDRGRQSFDSGSPAAAGQGNRGSPSAAAASRDGTGTRRTSLSSSAVAVPRLGQSGASPDQSPSSVPSALCLPHSSGPAVAGGVSVDSSFLRSRLRVNIGSPVSLIAGGPGYPISSLQVHFLQNHLRLHGTLKSSFFTSRRAASTALG